MVRTKQAAIEREPLLHLTPSSPPHDDRQSKRTRSKGKQPIHEENPPKRAKGKAKATDKGKAPQVLGVKFPYKRIHINGCRLIVAYMRKTIEVSTKPITLPYAGLIMDILENKQINIKACPKLKHRLDWEVSDASFKSGGTTAKKPYKKVDVLQAIHKSLTTLKTKMDKGFAKINRHLSKYFENINYEEEVDEEEKEEQVDEDEKEEEEDSDNVYDDIEHYENEDEFDQEKGQDNGEDDE